MPGLNPRDSDPEFDMTYSRVRNLGSSVGSYGQDLSLMSDKTKAIDMHALTFGVVGGGLNVAHRSVRDGAADALLQGQKVLESWKKALSDAADNTEQAEQASKASEEGGPKPPKIPTGGGGKLPGGLPTGGGLGGIDPPGGTKLPDDFKLPDDTKLPDDIKLPDDTKLPDDIKPPGDTKLPDDIKPPGDIKQPGLDDIKPPGDIKQPDLDGIKQPDLKNPDLSGVKPPDGTDLSGVDPRLNTPAMPQVQMPDSTTVDPRGSMPRTGVSLPDGGAGGAAGNGSLGAGQGSLSKALNSGMPLYPMGGGGAGGAPGGEDRDRERGAHLAEDEGVWGGDEDISPAVLGREV
ncbi:hypothetical protein [Nonomuraea glycinis]|uniref:hypothetical protein n=1 Tax=Nonomuraea glycinis TaxID=2047744 RepID=UPI002E120265|nr:hypothetical protein OHA68_19980 [Nonomuraea glycinis]